jgi:hypothetical protein
MVCLQISTQSHQNCALLNELAETRSKVIVHELLHLKYPNHGKKFKVLFKTHLSNAGLNCALDDLPKIKTQA